MLLFQWTSTELERHDRDTEEEATKPTKDTKGVSLHLVNQEVRSLIDLLTETPHQEEHASSADRWAIMLETAQRRGSRKGSTSSTMTIMNRFKFQLPPYHEIMWPP